jgi:SAM-dependent methyltransferase
MTEERDYVLGTHDQEIERLGIQHRVWRPRVLDVWRRAGFGTGQTLLDLGCGPGYASLDLARIVGPEGRVVAIDRSRRFLDALEGAARRGGRRNIQTLERDLDEDALPALQAHGVWLRWVLAFVRRPRELLARVVGLLAPGGTLVLHEYFHYATWRLSPRRPAFEDFVGTVIESWRASGGEPDVGLDLPRWLGELGLEIRSVTPIIDVIRPSHPMWQWPETFVEVGLQRLVDLGHLGPERAREVSEAFAAAAAAPHTLMITPAVLEVIAVRPGSGGGPR